MVSTIDSIYPKVLNYSDTLKLQGKWRQGSIHLANYYYMGTYCYTTDHNNYWNKSFACKYKPKVYQYIGIKINGKIGWIKLNCSSRCETLYFSEFSLLKN